MTTNQIRTEEQDTGLWIVFQGQRHLGVIWDANREAVLMDGGTPDYRALESWDYNIMPGALIKECSTWHEALASVVRFAKHGIR